MKLSQVFILAALVTLAGCSRDKLTTSQNADINLSTNAINFDTIFTTAGSMTKQFKVFNPNNGKLVISNISLRTGEQSFFAFNADGRNIFQASDIEIEANDSIYIFVTVKIDPTDINTPFIVRDTLDIKFNGNLRSVALSAWGQNAHFLTAKIIYNDTTWTNERPIVITGGVLIAEGVKLNITQGARIYMHADAPMIVDGTLTATGGEQDSTLIVFRGDRLDRYYRDLPGSWPGIYFTDKSSNSKLQRVAIRNAYQGVVCDQRATFGTYKLNLERCIIDNCYDAGIIGVNSSISATNSLVSNCGKNILLVQGGEYNFTHCTDVAIGNAYIQHRQPVLTLTDFIKQDNVLSTGDLKATFVNCIFWGDNGTVRDEVVTGREDTRIFEVAFLNCLWKVEEPPAGVSPTDIIANQDPLFSEINPGEEKYNFRLRQGSPALDKGKDVDVAVDLEGKSRSNLPDIGAFESTF